MRNSKPLIKENGPVDLSLKRKEENVFFLSMEIELLAQSLKRKHRLCLCFLHAPTGTRTPVYDL